MANQLAGMGWFNAIANMVMSGAPDHDKRLPRVLPASDWRHRWAEQTLRRLEVAIPMLEANEHPGVAHEPCPYPLPPPAAYPLVPRPLPGGEVSEHRFLGPPYRLLVVEGATTSNGFSYGVGGKSGSAGIVLYSGFFDDICPELDPPKSSFWSRLLGFPPPASESPQPTPEQTAKLAVLLSHEIAHLVLSHHLETLSAGTILFPNVLDFGVDLLRTIVYPWTMLFGPFLNDHLQAKSRSRHPDIQHYHDAGANRVLEIEADVVSARFI